MMMIAVMVIDNKAPLTFGKMDHTGNGGWEGASPFK